MHEKKAEIIWDDNADVLYQSLSTASHEIMNKLSFIATSYQFMSSKYTESNNFCFWKELGNSISDLSDYIKRTSECRYAHLIQRDNFCLDELLDLLDKKFNKYPNRSLICSYTDNTELYGDKEKLSVALSEIITNGIEHSISKIPVTLNICSTDSFVQFTITNERNPEKKDVLPPVESLFNPFQTSSRNHTGTGLYIASTIITGHFGTLSMSQNDQYTKASFSIPKFN